MKITKLLIANRGEIAIRVSRAATELEIPTVAIYTYEDRYSLHRYKADEAYQVGADNEPLKPYLDIDAIIRIARDCGANAIHPGYGFLSENAGFADACAAAGIIFVGPSPAAMRALGDKVSAKEVAIKSGLPIIESSRELLTSEEIALSEATRIGYPVMLKAAAGGGGRGMRVVRDAEGLRKAFNEARGEAKTAFGDDTVFLEKFVDRPKHIEIQIAADQHGNIVHLYERDCSVQRRFQKVVEMAPSLGLKQETREQLYKYAVDIAAAVQYNNLGTVEFLVDADEKIYFIEVNPRIQVEHTVTEMITGIDLIKTQLYIASGYALSSPEIGLGNQAAIPKNGFAIQCRITTEDPAQDFKPDYGTLTTYRNAAGFGVRLDEGSTYPGMKISPFFDSMLVKVSTHGNTLSDAAHKMLRALKEFRIRGVKNNIPFLENLVMHPEFITGRATVNLIAEHPELFTFSARQDRGTRMLQFLADVTVNGNPDVKTKDPEREFEKPLLPETAPDAKPAPGTKDRLSQMGPEAFCAWIREDSKIHYTDTTLRDGHQSLLATRMRTRDMLKAAEAFAIAHPQTFSMEVWGGATFDVCLRFLREDPWQRLAQLRKAVPNILLQMLIRGMNGVGYAAYPDNLIERFIQQSWETGVDIFRIFDSLNWMENIAPCIEAVRKHTGGIAEGTLCYTGDILNPKRTKYTLDYYVRMAKDLENAGAHMLGIKDMSGLLKPYAAKELIGALRDTVKIPLHLHTHDTSSLQPAMYLMAIEAGVDVVDCALGALSGMTSQPNFNAIVEMMRFHPREQPYDIDSLNRFSDYWETVREYYYPFGTTLELEGRLREKGIEPTRYETTCPFVEKVWNRAEKIGKEGYTIVVHGKPKHEETRATFSHSEAHTPTVVVKDMAQSERLARYITGEAAPEEFYNEFRGQYSSGFDVTRDLQRIGVVNQTTMLASETQGIADFLKNVIAQHYHLGPENTSLHFAETRDTLCYATNDNQSAVQGMLQTEADLALVIGGYNSSNTSHLVELCEQVLPTYFINHEDCLVSGTQIRHYDFHRHLELESGNYLPQKAHLRVMITSGASCPDALVERVIDRLALLTGNAGIEPALAGAGD